MAKRLIAFSAVLALSTPLWAVHTFFTLPVPFHPASPERQTMMHNQLRSYINEPNNGLSVTSFGGCSMDSESLAGYFMPFGKSCLRTGGFGSQAVKDHEVDILAHYFNVLNGENYRSETDIFPIVSTWTFQGHLSFRPVHSFWGVGFVYHRQLSERHDKGFWFEIAMPVMGIKNNMHMCETVEEPETPSETPNQSFFYDGTGSAAQCMTTALRSSNLQYGKIDAREYTKTKWGVADIEIQFGYLYKRTQNYHIGSYFGVLLPTSNAPTSAYLFEKIIGYNGHTGFFMGTRGGIAIWQHNENKISIELETSQTVFFDNTQLRSIDPYGKPWGRYLWVYPSNSNQANIAPGINYFTKAMYVTHGSLRNLNLAGTYNTPHFQGELGYHCYIRGEESVQLAKQWQENPAVAALWYSDNKFVGSGARRVSRNGATINEYLNIHNDFNNFSSTEDLESADNDTYIPIKRCDLDLSTAESPAVVMHTMYGSVGYGWYDCRVPTFINFAGSYNFGYGTAVLNHWKLWLKLGVSF